jgi:hypothetical protein
MVYAPRTLTARADPPPFQTHVKLFGRAPRLAAADRGFWNSGNEKAAPKLGVKQVVLPACGRL